MPRVPPTFANEVEAAATPKVKDLCLRSHTGTVSRFQTRTRKLYEVGQRHGLVLKCFVLRVGET